MLLDPLDLRSRADRLRRKADALAQTGRAVQEGTLRDGYCALVIEYDVLAMQLERLADRAEPWRDGAAAPPPQPAVPPTAG